MYKLYKHYMYILIVNILIPVESQSLQDMQRMKSEYEKFLENQKQQQQNIGQMEIIDMQTGLPKKAKLTPYTPQIIIGKEKKLEHFGYKFFSQRDTVAFWENLPTPVNYLLGPGDELVISLWGETQLREKYIISREGNIYDQKVGLLNITGKSMQETKIYMKEQFSRVYATLKGQNSSTFIDVSLGELRSINVNFVGQVKYPGVYPVHPFSTVITGLIQSGGVDTSGSLRNIQIKRDGKIFSKIDLYAYLLKGALPSEIQLRDQDIVVIPFKNSIVTVDSAVVSPGIFETAKGETIFNIIQYAGGLKAKSSSVIGLQRIKPMNKRNTNDTFESFYLNLDESKLIEVQNGDYITVRSIFQQQQFVQLIGQVKVPGIYNYYNGMRIKDLLKFGGGFEDSTFLKSIYKTKAEIIRRDPTSRYEKIITINLENISENQNIVLQNLDRIVIHANLNYFERKNVQILGEVNIPGSYPLLNDNESLKSLLNRAGDLSSKALDNGISIYRESVYFENPPEDKFLNQIQTQMEGGEIQGKEEKGKKDKIKLAWEGLSVILMPGDSIVVKEKVGAVFVTGQVYNSGLVEFQNGKSIRYYLDSAGGINNYGNRNNVIVVYPNGITVPWRRFRSPKIMDGSTIVVYQKADITPFDATAFAMNTTSLLSSLITLIVLVNQMQ